MIHVYEPLLDGNELRYVTECVETGWVSSLGKFVTRFEEEFAAYCGAAYGVSCSNGTTALHLALVALGIGPGDEVIIPDFTLIASANTVILAGARPVLVDIDPLTWCIDPGRIEEKITPRTRAIMAVHMYGHPCDLPALRAIAERHDLFIIEDCAEAHGAGVNGQRVGSFGDANCFSFYGNKILTTGEGGMVLTDDAALAQRLRLLRNQAFTEPRFVHDEIGFNYRLTNVQAAIGVAQLETLDDKIDRKRQIAATYDALLGAASEITRPSEADWAKNVYWMYGVVLEDSFGDSKDNVMRRLKANGVETRSFFCPMHLQPVFQAEDPAYPDTRGDYPVSTRLWERGLYLPSGPGLTQAQLETVAARLLECRQ